MLLETWIELEQAHGSDDNLALVKEKLPIKVKKRRNIAVPNETATQDGENAQVQQLQPDEDADMTGWEEYYDYVFPDDERSG